MQPAHPTNGSYEGSESASCKNQVVKQQQQPSYYNNNFSPMRLKSQEAQENADRQKNPLKQLQQHQNNAMPATKANIVPNLKPIPNDAAEPTKAAPQKSKNNYGFNQSGASNTSFTSSQNANQNSNNSTSSNSHNNSNAQMENYYNAQNINYAKLNFENQQGSQLSF